MMTGEVKLMEEDIENSVLFDNLVIGEGIVSKDGARIKVKYNSYLHFQQDGTVAFNPIESTPSFLKGRIVKFRLIAEEI